MLDDALGLLVLVFTLSPFHYLALTLPAALKKQLVELQAEVAAAHERLHVTQVRRPPGTCMSRLASCCRCACMLEGVSAQRPLPPFQSAGRVTLLELPA